MKKCTDLLEGSAAFEGSDGQARSAGAAKCKIAHDQ